MFATAADPLGPGSVLFKPCVGGRDHEQPPRRDPCRDPVEKQGGIVEPVDQVAGEDEVIAGVDRLEVAGIPLHEEHPRADIRQLESVERGGPRERKFALGGNLVDQVDALLQPHA